MKHTKSGLALGILLMLAVLVGLVATPSAQAQSYTVLHNFAGSPDGEFPYAGLIRDNAGSFYGTTADGGYHLAGTAFKLDKTGKEHALYSFTGVFDGGGVLGGVVEDPAGNLYGTTVGGGGTGEGVIFEVFAVGGEATLYSFTGGPDGGNPLAGVLRDAAGNLYGTAETGGDPSCKCGTVFKFNGRPLTVLHSFRGGTDGATPESGLLRDTAGNFYGTTTSGGGGTLCGSSVGCGTVFEVAQSGKEKVLYSFTGVADGANPVGGLIMDQEGNLYGTTVFGGNMSCPIQPSGCGTVFKVDPSGKETVLYSFTGEADGANPYDSLVMDAAGNLYGTTDLGGNLLCGGNVGCGTVFKLDTTGMLTVLHSFSGGEGANPVGGLVIDTASNLYGTTKSGGASKACRGGCGVVFEVTP
ncbi:MAG TPA: choice-of-anchor tandem repeat GloVer-containing protein [Terriglobia bacterium]|nr:choice-of-anchor tandem repeat GloVer-containing protein [Terriglobia bacterium]